MPRPPTWPSARHLGTLAIALALIGLGASLASLLDHLRADPTFCALEGCQTIRASVWAHPLGIPMPVFGILGFGGLLALAFTARERIRRLLALGAGVAGLGLVAVQAFVLDAWCALCLVADGAAIAHAIVVLAGATVIELTTRRALACVPALAAVVFVLGLTAHAAPTPQLAPFGPIVNEQTADRVTVVEYVDFECPHCRRLHGRLTEAIASSGQRVELVRKMVPLPFHPGAMPAALAWCCADAQGRGDAMADALIAADPAELTPAGCEAIAARVGCDLARFRADQAVAHPRVAADLADAKAAGVRSLPTLFVGAERIVGAAGSVGDLAAAIDRAAALVHH